MALLGKPSTAHQYDKSGSCIHCGMHRLIVDQLTHVCTKEREIAVDGWWMGKKMRSDAVKDELAESILEKKAGMTVHKRGEDD